MNLLILHFCVCLLPLNIYMNKQNESAQMCYGKNLNKVQCLIDLHKYSNKIYSKNDLLA